MLHQPIGVALLITPWNFPAAMATRKIAPALAAGCAVVLKPAHADAAHRARPRPLLAEAGVPAGVVNVVRPRTTPRWSLPRCSPTRACASSPSPARPRSAGSCSRRRRERVVKCSMELGGNAPFIVFADADLDAAVEGAMIAKMRHNGETCTAANRFYVEAPVAERVHRRLTAAMAALKMGHGLDARGAASDRWSTRRRRDKVARLVDAAVAAGAERADRRQLPQRPGFFYPPTVLAEVAPTASILAEEIFGPVAPIVPFRDEGEVIASPTPRSTAWSRTCTPATCSAGCAWPRRSNRGWSGSIAVSSPIPPRPSAASSRAASAARAATRACSTTPRRSTSPCRGSAVCPWRATGSVAVSIACGDIGRAGRHPRQCSGTGSGRPSKGRVQRDLRHSWKRRSQIFMALVPPTAVSTRHLPRTDLQLSGYPRFAWAVLAYNLFVILWGAFVRASGSGAGCGSHWPLCNGEIIPHSPAVATLIELGHRLTSGVSLILVGALVIGAWRRYPSAHPVRRAAAASAIFLVTEALIGAGLVLLELVAHNTSTARGYWVGGHLVNTFLLVGALTMTAWLATGHAPPRVRANPSLAWTFAVALTGIILLGSSGAVTALGDTLFPTTTLAEAEALTLSSAAHLFVRLRIWHPTFAFGIFTVVLYTIWRSAGTSESATVTRLAAAVFSLFTLQLAVGGLNVLLLAPIAVQLLHLLLAHAIWITMVLLAASALAAETPP